jgi:dihydrofolate reductase
MASGMGEERPPEPTPLLFGRRTYEDFYRFWPNQGPNPYTEVLTKAPKYVASTTLKEPLPWENSFLLQGDVPQAVAHLKSLEGPNLLIMGSGVLVQSLMKHNLVDRYVLLIHPLVLGTGRKLFEAGSPYTELRLVDSKITPKGVIIATFEP